jgi:hypothetical protein
MYILKPFKQVLVPVGMSLRGEVTVKAVDVTTGKVVDERKDHNTLLAGYLNSLFTNQKTMIGRSESVGSVTGYDNALYSCKIGTDNTPEAVTDTGIKGTQLASVTGSNVSCTAYGEHPIAAKRKFVFPAGTGTGEIGEAVLGESPYEFAYNQRAPGYGSGNVAKKTFTPKINKTEVVQLEIEWSLTVQRASDSLNGTIENGQRDGTTDINWTATLNNKQLFMWCFGYIYWVSAGISTIKVFVGPQSWAAEYQRCRVGDSNSPSVLDSDDHSAIKGTELFPISTNLTVGSVAPYTANSFYRDIEYGFDIGQANGAIGEIVPASVNDRTSNPFGLTRLTLNPPLDKPTPASSGWRTYLTVRYQIGQG